MTQAQITRLGQQIARALAPTILEMRNNMLIQTLRDIQPPATGMNAFVTRRQLREFLLQRGCSWQLNGSDKDVNFL